MKQKTAFNEQIIDAILLSLLLVAMCSQLNLGDIGRDTTVDGYVTKQLKVALPDIALFLNFLWFAWRTSVLRAWKKIWWPPFPCFALVLAMVLAALHSRPLMAAVAENLGDASGPKAILKALITKESKEAIAETIQFAGYFLIAPLLLVNLIHDRRIEPVITRRRLALWVFAISVTANVAWAVLQKIMANQGADGNAFNPQGFFSSPNAFSAFVALALTFCMARLLHGRTRTWPAIAIAVVVLPACAFTLVSLWAVFAIIGGTILLLALLRTQGSKMYALGTLLILFLGLWTQLPTPDRLQFLRVESPINKDGTRAKVKKQYVEWYAAATRLANSRESAFATGAAPGNYQFNIGTYFNRLSTLEKVRPDSNNLFLVQAVNLGMLGLGCLLWIVWHFGQIALYARRRHQEDWLGTAVLACIAVWFFLNIFHALIVRGTGVVFALILSLAVIAAEYTWDEERKKRREKRNFLDVALS